jgi:5-methylcytosine-specific restriction endonuclease McrA
MDSRIRQQVRERAGHACEYCRAEQRWFFLSFHVDHIIARRHGGGDDLDNLSLACPDCNAAKGTDLTAIDPDSGLITSLFHPRHDDWEDHFHVQEGRILGRTPVGRTTVWFLRMNRDDRVAHRLRTAGK